jgi:hypothetical protein
VFPSCFFHTYYLASIGRRFESPNFEIIKEFEQKRSDYKVKIANLFKKISSETLENNREHEDFIEKRKELMIELSEL